MKKILLLLGLLIAKEQFAQTFQLGVKGGLNVSNFSGGDFGTGNKALVGFHAGGLLRFNFGKLALQPEVVLSTQGARIEDAGETENYKLTYVNIPVMLQFHTTNGFYVEAGPQLGFKISEDIPDIPVENFVKSADLSLAIGLGFHSRAGIGIGARYNAGISKIGDFDPALANPDFRNGVFQVSLFYTFFNNKK